MAARVLFVGGSGHHYLREAAGAGLCLIDPADEPASRQFAARHGLDARDGTLAEAAAAFGPEVVSVGAVYGRNGDFVIDALRLNLPVVSDKPIAADRRSLAEVESLCDGGPTLVTEFDWRNRPELRAARAALLAGRIGPLALAVAQKSYRFGTRPAWYADARLYGGTMLWVASHGLDAIRFVCGGEGPSVLFARGGNVSRPDYGAMEDHVTAALSLPGGGTGLVHADLLNPAASATHDLDRIRLVGGHGEILVDGGRCVLTTDDDPPRDVTDSAEPTPPLAGRLLAAALGGSDPDYNTRESLASARLLLSAATFGNEP